MTETRLIMGFFSPQGKLLQRNMLILLDLAGIRTRLNSMPICKFNINLINILKDKSSARSTFMP